MFDSYNTVVKLQDADCLECHREYSVWDLDKVRKAITMKNGTLLCRLHAYVS